MATRRTQQIQRGAPERVAVARLVFGSLEELLVSEFGFGLKTATPVQRAVCWVLDIGQVPDHLWDVEQVQLAFGGVRPTEFRSEFLMVCGIRGAKTLIAAACVVWKALTLPLDEAAGLSLRPGELPRASIVSRFEDNAKVAFQYIVGAVTNSRVLRDLLVCQPTADTITLRNQSGMPVEVMVVAMSAAGVTLVSRWCLSCIFDEAPRMASEDEGKINLEQQRSALALRMIPGAVMMYVGSPLGAKGYVYDQFEENWKNPSPRLPVCKAHAQWLNPQFWTNERCEKMQREHPDEYETDVLANFTDPESQLFTTATLEACIRKNPLVVPYVEGKKYSAAMDPAMSVNAWTLVIAETPDNRKFTVVYAFEWRGSQTSPLSPKAVLTDMKMILDSYRIDSVFSDQYSQDAIKDIARDLGFGVVPITITTTLKKRMFVSLHARATTGMLELPPTPELKRDLQNVKKKFSRGDFQIVLVETTDGRHADFAPAVALVCGGYLEESPGEKISRETRISHMKPEEFEEFIEEFAGRDPMYDDEAPGSLGIGEDYEAW